jgi:hypothetical protein
MGNDTSADEIAAAAASDASLASGRPRSNSNARRIIKATHPKADAASLVVDVSDVAEEKEEKLEEDSSANSHRRHQVLSHPIGESPSVAREIEQEKAEHLKKERMQTAAERQRAKRDKEMQERRSNPRKHSEQETKANPMSRFLSVFSVESHPEHKRAFETSPEDKEDLNEPSGKRPRPSETSGGDDADKKGTTKFSASYSAVAVAIAAVVVGVVLRLRRSQSS